VKISKTYRPELLVSKGKEAHPLLTDPYLDVKNERLVATNGHGLVSLPVSVDKDESSRYLACSLLKAARALGEDDEPAEIKNEKVVKYGVLWPTAQERTFPDVKKLWPTFGRGSEGTVTFALNPGLLHAIANAMGVDAVCLTVELAATEENPSPIVVQPVFKKALEVGLLMPMRADGAGVPILAPDQVCRTCGRLLAAGASCPKCTTEDGAPAGSVAEAVGRVRSALAELQEKHPGAKVSVHFAPGVKTDPPRGSRSRTTCWWPSSPAGSTASRGSRTAATPPRGSRRRAAGRYSRSRSPSTTAGTRAGSTTSSASPTRSSRPR
jgi:hypothetical protein